MSEPACMRGETCEESFTCEGKECEHGRGSVACRLTHLRHECVHNWNSGEWTETAFGGTKTCMCGMSAIRHDMKYGP